MLKFTLSSHATEKLGAEGVAAQLSQARGVRWE